MCLGVIKPVDLNFHIPDVIRPPVDPKLTPPTQNGQNLNLELWPNLYHIGYMCLWVIGPGDFNFCMPGVTRPPVDPKLTPPTQNGQSFNLE